MKPLAAFSIAALVAGAGVAAGPKDPDTRDWWAITAALSNDKMEGRDTGSAGYDRAAKLVAARFAKAGLKPLGQDGGWFQPVPMRQVDVLRADASVGGRNLRFLHDWTVAPVRGMATMVEAPLTYGGYCAKASLYKVRGRFVICHGTHRAGLPSQAEREAAVKAAGGLGIVTISDPGFTVEPPRWPFAYARTVWIDDKTPPIDGFLRLTLNADALATVVGRAHDATKLIADGSAGRPLPTFALAQTLKARFLTHERSISSSNVVGMLPGSDPASADQAIVLSAHLDGYGYGEAVNGDGLYNGTLDDAAYVALLIREAERLNGKGLRRPIIFAAFTGEEKGLLGARWFVAHPTVPLARIAADINLDQLRPIFPLKLLTVHGLDDSTLGDDVRAVANGMGVDVQHDPEPERNLLRRADQWPFMEAGVPGTAFVFGYKPGTESERIYRNWYRTGYHKPQDDLNQPMDWQAAADFNRFFYSLVEKVADQPEAPAWHPGSKLRPKS